MQLLHVKSSVCSGNGQSSRLADQFVADLRAQDPRVQVVERDLAAEPVPNLDGARVGAFFAKPEERTAEKKAVIAESDALINELTRGTVIDGDRPIHLFIVQSDAMADL